MHAVLSFERYTNLMEFLKVYFKITNACYFCCYTVGTFHLLHILIDDYIMHCLESAAEEEEELVYKRRIDVMSTGNHL